VLFLKTKKAQQKCDKEVVACALSKRNAAQSWNHSALRGASTSGAVLVEKKQASDIAKTKKTAFWFAHHAFLCGA
jgi:hypothetical protein